MQEWLCGGESPISGTLFDIAKVSVQSLHTTVLPIGASRLLRLEVQIRTAEMDRLAQYGIAGTYTVHALRLTRFTNGITGNFNGNGTYQKGNTVLPQRPMHVMGAGVIVVAICVAMWLCRLVSWFSS